MPNPSPRRAARLAHPHHLFEPIEPRLLLSAAFDTVGLTALRADPAFNDIDGSGIGIAILDTGLFSTHPDLSPNFAAWYDAVDQTDATAPFDPNGHGTHVAGTAAARDPDIGVATRARLIGVRALPDGNERPRHDTVAAGLQWVIDNQSRYNIRVVNMSLGVPGHNFNSVPDDPSGEAALIRRLERLGVTVVTASGNSYADFGSLGASTPAVFSSLSVASTWEDNGVGDNFPLFAGGGGPFAAFEREGRRDRLAGSSQRSSLPNQVAAPGQSIFSTWNGAQGQMFNTIYGTSMASPLVAGMVALMQDAAQTFGGRYLSTPEVVSIIRSTADTITDAAVSTNGRIEIATRRQLDLPETGQSFLRVNINSAIRRVRMTLTGSESPNPVPGDGDNTTMTSIALGLTNGTMTLAAHGAIGTDGQLTAGGADVDLYRFELTSPGALDIALSSHEGSPEFDTVLRLFDASGAQFAINDDAGSSLFSRIQTGPLQPGTYYAGVSGFGNDAYNIISGAGGTGQSTGVYAISIGLNNPDPDGVVSGARVLDDLPFFFDNLGSIGFDGDVDIGAGDVDFFLVTAPDTGTLGFTIDTDDLADGADTLLRVFDEELNELASNDDREPGDIDPLIALDVVKGQRVWVSVSDFQNAAFDPADPFDRPSTGAGGFYELFVIMLNGDQNGTIFDAVPLDPGVTLAGLIGSDFGGPTIGSDGSKDVDFFAFTPDAGGVLDLLVSSPDSSLRPVVALWKYDAATDDVTLIGRTAASASDNSVILRAFVAAGEEYYASVTGLGNDDFDWFAVATGVGGDTGAYSLTANLRARAFSRAFIDNSVNLGTPVVVSLANQVSAEIGADGPFALDGFDIDLYTFTAPATQTIVFQTFTTAEDATDTVLRLFDAAGNQLRVSDDISDTNRGSRIRFTVQAGQTYLIGVNGYSADAFIYDPITGDDAADGDTGAYVLSIGPAAAPEIELLSTSGTPILNGDATPSLDEGSRFGSAAVLGLGGSPVVREFTIFNSGNRPLQLNGAPRLQLSGVNAADFSTNSDLPASIPARGSATFQVLFSPTLAGTRRATLTIPSNDADEASFTFALAGQGANRPEIDLQGFNASGSARAIRAGDATPSLTDGTRFGSTPIGQSIQREFIIRNLGRKLLRLNGTPRILISGAAASDFSIIDLPAASIRAAQQDRLVIRFAPSAAGARRALITIASDDADESAYTFAISGAGLS
ncbi:MAG: S8 family serine peptidase [Phycisphaerales bacterium]|nr:S8 family serine peptidase [Phycisphaerales bacterium]